MHAHGCTACRLHVICASAINCIFINPVHTHMCWHNFPLPLSPNFKLSLDVASFSSQCKGRGRPSPQQGPPSSCLLGSYSLPWPPGSYTLSYLLLLPTFSTCHFPLASSSTCKHTQASSSILKHPPFFSLLLCAALSAPHLAFPPQTNFSGQPTSAFAFLTHIHLFTACHLPLPGL